MNKPPGANVGDTGLKTERAPKDLNRNVKRVSWRAHGDLWHALIDSVMMTHYILFCIAVVKRRARSRLTCPLLPSRVGTYNDTLKRRTEMIKALRPAQMVAASRGLYARVARKMRCDASYVSRIARGERRSRRVEAALNRECLFTLRRLKLRQDFRVSHAAVRKTAG